MSARQPLAEIVALDQIAEEYKKLIQIAGLRAGIVDVCRQDATSPDDFRRMLTRTLQSTLPSTALRSVRADASHMPNTEFAQTEAKVREAIFDQAHQSETLRPVTTRDRSGRDVTEYFGQKAAWMRAYSSPPRLAKTIGGELVRLSVIVS
ncbi:hypothetical protein [Burkholderia sp. S171]|uniref:hypothetical protein n=1 Tax=Burkholderia sp. S171 TaxID=1641860 RepID=UPI00131C7BBD|nr:hypothetical protein [Burkholderia sp. S171]